MGANRDNEQQEYARDSNYDCTAVSTQPSRALPPHDMNDPFVAEELKRLAAEFERRAQVMCASEPGTQAA